VPKHDPEVQRAINKKRGHVWVFLPGPGHKLVLSDKPKGEWGCEVCGLKCGLPRAAYGHEDEECPARGKL
jgi:hypothetical protein